MILNFSSIKKIWSFLSFLGLFGLFGSSGLSRLCGFLSFKDIPRETQEILIREFTIWIVNNEMEYIFTQGKRLRDRKEVYL